MSIRVALHHNTIYDYDRLATLSPQVVRLRPAPHCRTPIHQLLAEDRACESFHQLAAGSARQFPGSPGLSEADAIFSVEVVSSPK